MKTKINWQDGMQFNALIENHTVTMDAKAPIGKDLGPTPKELVAIGLGGCTAMDVIALLKKHKQPPTKFTIEVDIKPSSSGHPVVFEKATLTFALEGEISLDVLKEAVHLSQTKYCGVSAMLSQALPIEYKVILNDQEIATGFANFEKK